MSNQNIFLLISALSVFGYIYFANNPGMIKGEKIAEKFYATTNRMTSSSDYYPVYVPDAWPGNTRRGAI